MHFWLDLINCNGSATQQHDQNVLRVCAVARVVISRRQEAGLMAGVGGGVCELGTSPTCAPPPHKGCERGLYAQHPQPRVVTQQVCLFQAIPAALTCTLCQIDAAFNS